MKRILFFTLLSISIMHNSAVSGGGQDVDPALLQEIESKTMRPFFNALKNGNVEVIKQHISGEMYEESRILLEENEEYPAFLREHYRDARFSVKRGVSSDKGAVVDVMIEFPGGGKQVFTYQLQEQESPQQQGGENRGQQVSSERHWRIFGEERNGGR